jgi:hypothetical protein
MSYVCSWGQRRLWSSEEWEERPRIEVMKEKSRESYEEEVMPIWVVAFYHTHWLPSDAGNDNLVVYKAHAIACIVPE